MTGIVIPPECLPPAEPQVRAVVAAVAERWSVLVGDIRGPSRARRIVAARRAAVTAVRMLCPSASLAEIGAEIGRDHTTVINLLRPRRIDSGATCGVCGPRRHQIEKVGAPSIRCGHKRF